MTDLIKLSVSLDDMEEYEPLPNGTYPAEIRSVEEKYSEGVPGGYYKMALRIDPDDFPADYDPANAPEGVQVVWASLKRPDPNERRTIRPFKQFIKAVGGDLKAAEFNTDDWVGQHVQVLLTVSEYQGALVNNVQGVSELPSV